MRIALLVLLALAPAQGERLSITARHGKSWRGTLDGFPVLMLRGDARDRGLAQGALAGREIVAVLDAIVSTIHRQRPGAWASTFVPATRAFHWPPRFATELQAILEGMADRAVPALGRDAALDDLKALNALSDVLGTGCSSFSAWGRRTADGKTITGRNADYSLFPVLGQVMLIATMPSEKDLFPTLDLGAPGNVGASTALNSDGAFLALHDEAGLPGAKPAAWLPRTIALRQAIEKARGASAAADVAEALRASPTKVGNNVHVSGAGSAPAVVEWDGHARDSGATLRAGKDDLLVCTNHYLARADRGAVGDSQGRAEALRAEAEKRGRIDFDAAKAMLDRVAKSGGTMTYFSVVAWPSARRYAFALAPAMGTASTKGRWISADWAELFRD